MAKFNVLSKQCPVCNGKSVQRIGGQWGFTSPTHRCSDCNAVLKATFTVRALWSIPVAAISLTAMYFLVSWLQQSQDVGGIVRAMLVGAVVGLAGALPAGVALRGVVLRPCAA